MTRNATEAAGCDESSGNIKEENLVKMYKKEEEEQKVCGEFTFLFVSHCGAKLLC